MNKLLKQIFERSVELLKQDSRCLGGWHFGSISRKQEDEFSDVDPVFLIKEKDFEDFDAEIPRLFHKISKDCILIWPEEFNSDSLRNYAILIKGVDDYIVQYDFTIMNSAQVEKPFCKVWYKDCNVDNIIFDTNGNISKLLKSGTDEGFTQIDTLHQIKKYWLFCFLAVKYYKRKDIFKLLSAMQDLFHTHLNILFSIYKNESWGGWPSLIKNNIPSEKQNYLLKYFCNSDITNISKNLFYVIDAFSKDICLICKNKGIEYDSSLEQSVKNYIIKNMVN